MQARKRFYGGVCYRGVIYGKNRGDQVTAQCC